jgi:hypothetical protein
VNHRPWVAVGLDFIFEASHIEGKAFLVPIHMLVVDQRGEAAHVRCDGEGYTGHPMSCLW